MSGAVEEDADADDASDKMSWGSSVRSAEGVPGLAIMATIPLVVGISGMDCKRPLLSIRVGPGVDEAFVPT
jgi:hypothetical protein